MKIKKEENEEKDLSVLKNQVKQFPAQPGVYMMKDQSGKVLYVGKATSLHDRVSSYFQAYHKIHKIRALLNQTDHIEFIITQTPYEALILECNFIKKYSPYFNVMLKDSKNYLYLKITSHEYPAIARVRTVQQDKAHYFGPYTSAKAANALYKLIQRTFQIRHCKGEVKILKRPCLSYFLQQCSAPCIENINHEAYLKRVQEAVLFLKQDYKPLKNYITQEMNRFAEEENFEMAAYMRDQLYGIDEMIKKQRVIYAKPYQQDVWSVFKVENLACVELMKIRDGKIIFEDKFFHEQEYEESEHELLRQFLIQYYFELSHDLPPKEILLSNTIEDAKELSIWMKEKFFLKKMDIIVPRSGDRKQVVNLAMENAKKHFDLHYQERFSVSPSTISPLLMKVQEVLHLPSIPVRMEGYDISNISGVNAVGSMVVLINGKPAPAQYRIFKIKHTKGPNDFAMIHEVISRRIRHRDKKFGELPDVFVIDGGPIQLKFAREALEEANILIPVVSLAKKEELIYLSEKEDPIRLEQTSEILKLLQRIRDESHRFAKRHFTKLHRKAALSGNNRKKSD